MIGREGPRLDGIYASEADAEAAIDEILQGDYDHNVIWLRTDQPNGYVRLSSIDMLTIHKWK